MSSDQSAWFVKASFGAELGPMSARTLLQMAAEGAFASDDVARCGTDGSWQPVPAVLDALRSDNVAEAAVAMPVVRAATAESSAVHRGSLPGWTNYWSAAPNGSPEESARTDEPSSATIETSPANSEGDFADLTAWKRERQERLDRLLQIVAKRESEATEARSAAAATQATQATSGGEHVGSAAVGLSDSTAQPVASRSLASTRAAARRRDEEWEQTLARWRRSIPDWRIVVPLLLLPWAAWYFWPLTQARIAENYWSMYAELRHLRDLPLNKTDMDDFVARSQETLDEVLPRLNRSGTSADRDTELLLRIGRDGLQPMLQHPRQRGSASEALLQQLFAEWDEAHGIHRSEAN